MHAPRQTAGAGQPGAPHPARGPRWSPAAGGQAPGPPAATRRPGPRRRTHPPRRAAGVQVLEGNLRRVIGGEAPGAQLRALSREAMRSYARYWLEAFRLPVMPVDRLVAGMRDTGHTETAFGYLAAGRGVVFAL